jgi:hypothetical protein
VAAAVLGINFPGWRLELYHQLGLPKLSPEAKNAIHDHDKQSTERAAKRQQPSENRKCNLSRKLRRNYSRTIEIQNPEYKGITKTTAKKRGEVITHRTLDETLTARFPSQGGNNSDDDGDYRLPANNEEEDEDDEDTATVDQRRMGAESSDDEADPSSCQSRDEFCQLLTDAEKWENDDDEPFVVQPWHIFDEIDLLDS